MAWRRRRGQTGFAAARPVLSPAEARLLVA
jgi:hypothetical protein